MTEFIKREHPGRRYKRPPYPYGLVCIILGVIAIPVTVYGDDDKIKAQVERLLATEGKVLESLDGLDRQIVALESEQARISLERKERLRSVGEVDEKIKEVQIRLGVRKKRLKRRLRARSNLQREGAVWRRLILGRGTQNDWLRRRGYLAAIVRSDLSLIKGYKQSDRRLATLRADRMAAVAVVRAKEAELAAKRAALKKQRDLKAAALTELRTRQNLLRQVLYAQTERQSNLKITGRGKPTGIIALRGNLSPPVNGRVIRRYGLRRHAELGTKIQSKGWVFRARLNEPVKTIFDGTIAYSGWYTGFGNLIIVDHGQNHHSIYAHLNVIHRAKGEAVKRGELIGRVGDSGSLSGPQLYFEMRVSRRPVDPARWIKRK